MRENRPLPYAAYVSSSHSWHQEASMEDIRFDTLARAVGSLTTRRLALAALLGGVFGRLGPAETAAKRKSGRCKPKCGDCYKCAKGKCRKNNQGEKVCKKGRCKLKATGTPCTTFRGGHCQNGTCFPTSTCPVTTTAICPGGMGVRCGGVDTAPCLCSRSTEGQVACIIVPSGFNCPDVTPCGSSATCGAGYVCVETGSCCPNGPANACLLPCPTPAF
jgi:hypothetical protein